MIEVALFPIPDCATFPGTVFPLHVFEPRYRAMIKACVKEQRLLGICHTEALIKPASLNQSPEQALSSNQATYRPYLIFSAGKVTIESTLPDGRMLINVNLQDRFEAVEQVQELPYSIFNCRRYKDRPIAEDELIRAADMKQLLLNRLMSITKEQPHFNRQLQMDNWQLMDAVDFSFQIFGILRTEGDILQQILQCRSPIERLNIGAQLLEML